MARRGNRHRFPDGSSQGNVGAKFPLLHVSGMSTRNQFGHTLVDRGLTESAVEVGTHRGQFTKVLMATWPGTLYCVDPWSVPAGYERQAGMLPERGSSREADYQHAKTVLQHYKDRVLFMRCLSMEALNSFKDGYLDFVYIDGNHEYPHVRDDVREWYRKLHRGGILAGHDFICPGEKLENNWGVNIQPAVLEFASEVGVDVYLIVESHGHPWSWYLTKP